MEHLNDIAKGMDALMRLRMMTLPHMYFARSIKDFLYDKDAVLPTSYARVLGKRFLHRPHRNDRYLLGAGVIIFYELRHSVQDDTVVLEDITGSLTAQMPSDRYGYLASLQRQGIAQRDRIQCAEMLYYPENGSRRMWAVKKLLDIPSAALAAQEASAFALSPAFGF